MASEEANIEFRMLSQAEQASRQRRQEHKRAKTTAYRAADAAQHQQGNPETQQGDPF